MSFAQFEQDMNAFVAAREALDVDMEPEVVAAQPGLVDVQAQRRERSQAPAERYSELLAALTREVDFVALPYRRDLPKCLFAGLASGWSILEGGTSVLGGLELELYNLSYEFLEVLDVLFPFFNLENYELREAFLGA